MLPLLLLQGCGYTTLLAQQVAQALLVPGARCGHTYMPNVPAPATVAMSSSSNSSSSSSRKEGTHHGSAGESAVAGPSASFGREGDARATRRLLRAVLLTSFTNRLGRAAVLVLADLLAVSGLPAVFCAPCLSQPKSPAC